MTCNNCKNNLTDFEIGHDVKLAAQYGAAGHTFLCNSCIDNTLKGENK
jgi:hypothetical protein